jgi:PhnB protein
MPVKHQPDTFHTVTPTLRVRGAAKLIEFTKRVFGAEEVDRYDAPNGAVLHAEVRIGDSIVMTADAAEEAMPGALYVFVRDVDAAYGRALEAGARSLQEPEDQFYGARVARVKDPFGNVWAVATQKEDVSPEEVRRRFAELMKT